MGLVSMAPGRKNNCREKAIKGFLVEAAALQDGYKGDKIFGLCPYKKRAWLLSIRQAPAINEFAPPLSQRSALGRMFLMICVICCHPAKGGIVPKHLSDAPAQFADTACA